MAHDGTGTGWTETYPANAEYVKDGALEVRDLRIGTRIRVAKEHTTPAAASAGGEHKAGSAVVYRQASEPTLRPDAATSLTAADTGRLFVDSDDECLYHYVHGTGWVATKVSAITTALTASLLPPGMVMPYGGSSAPTGWLLCDGSNVSRVTYAALFAAIGTTYGAGDGATTFGLPDTKGRAIIGTGTGSGLTARAAGDKVGTETHQLVSGEIPAHTHTVGLRTQTAATGPVVGVCEGGSDFVSGSTGGGGAHQNMQPSLAMNWIIKT